MAQHFIVPFVPASGTMASHTRAYVSELSNRLRKSFGIPNGMAFICKGSTGRVLRTASFRLTDWVEETWKRQLRGRDP
jgi:hypothetical protein